MSRPLFSFGTSRGGTTFFARILSVNKAVKVASDPFMPLFRDFRNEIIRQKIDAGFNTEQPLDDYYFSDRKRKMMKTVQESSLEVPFPQDQLRQLRLRLAARMSLAAGELVPFVDEVRGENFFELFSGGLSLLEKAYQAEEAAWCGSNDNWVIEFLPVLARSFPEAKFIVVIRDPRGAIASAMKIRAKRPSLVPLIYSFAHHWRKHAAFAWKLMRQPELKGRLFVFRYEDLVSSPEEKVREICAFLGVSFDPDMLVPGKFRPLRGNEWTGNSNFSVPQDRIYTDSTDSWKRHLDRGDTEFVEFVCDPEMRLFGYQPQEYGKEFPSPEVMRFFLEDDKRTQGWRGQHQSWDREHSLELFRKQALRMDRDLLTADVIEKYFLFEEVFDACRGV